MYEKSTSSKRQKLSLRGILDFQSLQLQNPFQSLTLKSRPQTSHHIFISVQNQSRQKIISEYPKPMTEQRMRKSTSQQLVKMATPLQKQTKHKLKHTLGKITALSNGKLIANNQQILEVVNNFLLYLSKTDNFYREAFQYIHKAFINFIYVKIQNLSQTVIKNAYAQGCQPILRLASGCKTISFQQLAKGSLQTLNELLSRKNDQKKILQNKIKFLQGKIVQANNVIARLTKQVKYYEQHPSKDLFHLIETMEHQTKIINQKLKKSNVRITQLQNQEDYLQQYNNMLLERIQEMRHRLVELETTFVQPQNK